MKIAHNIWAEIGSDASAEKQARAQLMVILRQLINEHGLNQRATANLLGISQPRVSALINGKIKDFSVGVLLEFLSKMGWKVDFGYSEGQMTAKAKAA